MEGKKTIALISHDGKKLDMCLLVVEHLRTLLTQFDHIICTVTHARTHTHMHAPALTLGCVTCTGHDGRMDHQVHQGSGREQRV
jgi:methylglyoxal synthase